MNVIVCLGFVLGALSAAATVTHTKPGQSVTLECGVASYSRSVTWKHKDQMIIQKVARNSYPLKGSAAIKQRSRLMQDKNLLISGVRREDAGAFTCEADGRPHVHTLLVVSVSSRPSEELQPGGEVTLQCEVAGLNPDSPVQWKGPNGRPPHAGSNLHLNPVGASDAGAWQCEFSLGGETYREELNVRVKEPVSTPSPPVLGPGVNKETPCPGCADPRGWGGPLGWWLWAAAGAGGVVVLLLTVLVIVFCRRIRRRKRKLQKMMKNGQRSARPKTYCQCNCRAAAEKPQRGRQKARPSTLALKPLLME